MHFQYFLHVFSVFEARIQDSREHLQQMPEQNLQNVDDFKLSASEMWEMPVHFLQMPNEILHLLRHLKHLLMHLQGLSERLRHLLRRLRLLLWRLRVLISVMHAVRRWRGGDRSGPVSLKIYRLPMPCGLLTVTA